MTEATKTQKILKMLDTAVFQNPDNQNVYEFPLFFMNGGQQEQFAFSNETYTDDMVNTPTTIIRNTTLKFYPTRYRISSLRMFIDIVSLTEVTPYQATGLKPESILNQEAFFHELTFPKFRFELLLGDSIQTVTIGSFNLQNKRPGYYVNLLRYLTENVHFIGDSSTQVSGRITNMGDGMPGISDIITFYGDAEMVGDYIE